VINPGEGFYQKALNIILEKTDNPVIYIFSDDIAWVKQNVEFPYSTKFVSEPDYIELFLMSQCKYNIIANSTFSWWAAWLNTFEGKIVVAPKNWHNSKANKSIYPSDWITI
jgi:hypothetical protein